MEEEMQIAERETSGPEAFEQSQASAAQATVPSWTYYALALTVLLVAVDMSFDLFARDYFWSAQTLYGIRIGARAVLLFAATFGLQTRFFPDRRSRIIVTICIGGIAGALSAAIRHAFDPSFGSAINLLVEPVDSALIALAAGYAAGRHRITNSN